MEDRVLDITTVEKGYIFHQVDTTYAMEAGLALDIVSKWPGVQAEMQRAAPSLGTAWPVIITQELSVVNLVVQRPAGCIGKQTLYWALAAALRHAHKHLGCDSLWFPCYFPLYMGGGHAGGNWSFVWALIEEQFPNAIICRRKT